MQKNLNNLKCLLIGTGSIGKRHLFNLNKIGLKNIAIYDNNLKTLNSIPTNLYTKKFSDLSSAFSFEPDFSLVSTYPNSHLKIANLCIENDSHLFIEKPLSSSLIDVEKMLRKADKNKIKIAVGYQMRFDRGLTLLKNSIANSKIGRLLSISAEWGYNIKLWRPGTDYRNHYILKKGSGIILDASHEYDYLGWLINDEVHSVYCQSKKVSNIETETEGLAAIILKFKNGIIGSLLIDYVRSHYHRSCQIIGEEGTINWQHLVQGKSAWKNYKTKVISKVTTSKINKNYSKQFLFPINDLYVKEMKNFIRSIITDSKPFVDGWDGLKTLQIGIAALESAKINKVIKINSTRKSQI